MSARDPPATYRTNTGGTIHTETTNPALLALLRDNSEVGAASTASYTAPVSAPVSTTDTPRARARSLEAGTTQAHTPRSISQIAQRGDNAERGDNAASPPRAAQGDRSGKQSLAVTPVSRNIPSATDSSSSELARLVGTPSRKSFALSTTVTEVDSAEADDLGGLDDVGDCDVTPTGGTDNEDLSPSPVKTADRSLNASVEETPVDHSQRTSRAAPALSPLPAGGRTSVSVNANPLLLRGPGLPSPDLQDPDHQRFVTPYASRRLKDRPLGRSPAYGGLQGAVPKDQSWSASQAARLRAHDSDANNNGRSNSSFGEVDSEAPPQQTASDTNLAGSSVDGVQPADTLEAVNEQEASEPETDSDFVTDDNENDIGLKPAVQPTSPSHTVVEKESETPKPEPALPVSSRQPSASSTVQHKEDPAPSPKSQTVSNQGGASGGEEPSSQQKADKPSGKLAVEAGGQRVYVESPSFTQEEEEEYRFVSSRVDNYEDHDHETFRGLDEAAVKSMEGGSVAVRPTRKPFKQVRYQDDEERFEDREDILHYRGADSQPRGVREPDPAPAPPPKQYVLKSKTGSASSEAAANSQPPPVRGLVLPSGPSWDPGDEEDLRREESYQQQLKHRITDVQREAEETVIPRLPLFGGESEDFARDSLDVPEDIELDSQRHNIHRDSLDVYDQQRLQQAMRNTQWDDPPAPPPRAQFAPVQPQRQNQQGYGGNMARGQPNGYTNSYYQQQLVDADMGPADDGQYASGPGDPYGYDSNPQQQMRPDQYGYGSNPPPQMRPDPYGQRVNPQMRPDQAQFAQQPDGQPQVARTGHYMERTAQPQNVQASSSAELKEGFYMTEPRGFAPGGGGAMAPYRQDFESNVDDGTVGYFNQSDRGADTDRYELQDNSGPNSHRQDSAPYEMGKPPRPSYDYVAKNKQDYGRTHRRTYKKIHEVQKEEKEKLSGIFIQPKVKGKGHGSQRSSRDNSPSRYPAIAESPGEEMQAEQYDTGAETLWAQRSATLARAKNPQTRKKQNSGASLLSNNGSLQRMHHSDSSLHSSPTLQRLIPAPQQSPQVGQMQSTSPVRRPLELKPMTQELVTEDGQRISVDVNLRLISPPIPGEGSPGVPTSGGEGYMAQWQGMPPTGYQYPVEDVQKNGQQQYAIQDENEYPHGRYSADDVLSSKNYYSSHAGGYASDSAHDYTAGTYTTNPYKKIPPIPSSNDSVMSGSVHAKGAPRSAPVHSEGSYMQTYLREKEKSHQNERPWYRVYGLKDYKRMQKEVRLGTLGPDLENDTYKERREKMLRQMEYAKAVKEKNTQDIMTKKPPAFPRPKEQDDIMNKRKVAVEYAKNVPKPTVRPKPNPYNSYELASQLSPIAKPHSKAQKSPTHEPSVDVLDLQKLHERHEQDKRSAALIRQKAQGVLS
ncbi:hypothetical protein BaRGS_00036233 [Batillaria attramentaria]|uniref:Uncharacterized protein n=1 Tax=Batillaria attramentaria TaxID=370345 RepID=A0ABD0JCH5_9CAEN